MSSTELVPVLLTDGGTEPTIQLGASVRQIAESIHVGTVMGSKTTSQQTPPAILPQRFNSTSQPCPRSIIQPELNSISVPKTK